MPEPAPAVVVRSPAKINLALAVTGRRADGYHLLDSIVAFAELHDIVTVTPSATAGLALSVDGPFAASLSGEVAADNLIARAWRAFGTSGIEGLSVRLTKRIPVAAGLGGGSADAAAMLFALDRLGGGSAGGAGRLAAMAASVGADVPVCLASHGVRMGGIGEHLAPLALPSLPVVLVNPRCACPTAAVFRAHGGRLGPALTEPPATADAAAWIGWLSRHGRNDLTEAAAVALPAVAEVLTALEAHAGGAPVGLSGSGATGFAVLADDRSAERLRDSLAAAHPGWWCHATRITDWPADRRIRPA